MDDLAQDTDPVATVTWEPPLYPDTVEMGTGRDLLAEIAQLQTELQVKCTELANLEDERAVTVLELEQARKAIDGLRSDLEFYVKGALAESVRADRAENLFQCANKAKREAKRGH